MDGTRAQGLRTLPFMGSPHRTAASIITVGILLFAGCLAGTTSNEPSAPQVPTGAKIDEFFIVDCALPPQIRQLGRDVTYVTRRQAIKTSARDCQIRGGEYVAFDRANYATSLKVWLPNAEQGDPAAQTYVGEIFEKGLGVAPDYAAAAVWYRRAAEKGYSRAAINLGNLYEQGLGVPKDNALALNWYRRAAGLGELSFGTVSQSQAAETQRLRDEVTRLQRELKTKQEELDRIQRELQNSRRNLEQRRIEADSERSALARLRQELEERRTKAQTVTVERRDLERSIAEREARLATKDREVTSLRASLTRLEAESTAQRKEIASLQQRATNAGSPVVGAGQAEKIGYPIPTKGMSFGNYHALVIGNNDYRLLPRLETAVNDAKEVARLLREQYGFKVTLLLNANRYDILSALNSLRERLTDEDNLLIYYAGHGELDRRNQRGHWLPVDAEPDSSTNWISNIQITDILNAMTVKQLLVVADSCYAGTLSRSALGRLEGGVSKEENVKLIQLMARQRSRMVMTSGGVEPVIDRAGGPYSVFARPFIELLQANTGVLPGQEMFHFLQRRVAVAAQRLDARQVPEYAPIKLAGHESGDFFFVRAAS
jgi:hypothetical protein